MRVSYWARPAGGQMTLPTFNVKPAGLALRMPYAL